MPDYWQQRDISQRLANERFERKMTRRDIECDDGELPAELLELIEAFYLSNGLLTQYRIEDDYG